MSRKLINEIESKIAWNDMNINETSISLGDVKRLLNELDEQTERVEELEKEKDEWKYTAQSYYMTNQELREQNKRLREALEQIANSDGWLCTFWEAYERCVETARKALEDEE